VRRDQFACILTIEQPSSGITCTCQTNARSRCVRSDQARGDLYAIGEDLEFIKTLLARLPTRKEMAQTALLVTLTTAALVLVGFEGL
jgi:hypothetical protein